MAHCRFVLSRPGAPDAKSGPILRPAAFVRCELNHKTPKKAGLIVGVRALVAPGPSGDGAKKDHGSTAYAVRLSVALGLVRDLARSAGIEPTTPGFGGQYSIH